MKLTITTLVIVEGSYIQGIFHSLEEHPGKAYQELVDQVENEYGYDADKDHVPLHFKTIQDIENYFELVHIETQELTSTGFKTTNPSSRITISQNGNQILSCKVYKEPNYILSMSNEEILELISGLDYIGNLPTVPDLEKPIEIQVSTTRQIPLEQNKEVQTKIKEIIYNNLYDTLVNELKGTISRFQAQYNIQEINPYLQDILQNPEDLVSLSPHHKR